LEAKSEEAKIPKELYSQEGCNSTKIYISLEEGKEIDLVNSACIHLGPGVPISISGIIFWRCL